MRRSGDGTRGHVRSRPAGHLEDTPRRVSPSGWFSAQSKILCIRVQAQYLERRSFLGISSKGPKKAIALGLVSLGAIFMSPQRPTDEPRLTVIRPAIGVAF